MIAVVAILVVAVVVGTAAGALVTWPVGGILALVIAVTLLPLARRGGDDA